MGIIQARILEWVAFPSPGDLPNPGIEPRSPTLQADSLPSEPPGKISEDTKSESEVAQSSPTLWTPWTVAYPNPNPNPNPLSMEFSMQEYWSGLPFPSPRDLPDPGIEPGSPALLADTFTI